MVIHLSNELRKAHQFTSSLPHQQQGNAGVAGHGSGVTALSVTHFMQDPAYQRDWKDYSNAGGILNSLGKGQNHS